MQKKKQEGRVEGWWQNPTCRHLPRKLLKNQKEKWLKAARAGIKHLKKEKTENKNDNRFLKETLKLEDNWLSLKCWY